jgi:RHS repeat-associated protein
VGGGTTNYVYEGTDLIRETGAGSADYVVGPGYDEELAMVRGGSAYYYGVDGRGSVTVLLDTSAHVQNTYLYDVWGATRASTGQVANPFGFQGREFGEASTLFYRARYYLPGNGRFVSEDPRHRDYSFVFNNPTAYRDPGGMDACPAGCNCGGWATVHRTLDLGEYVLWQLFDEQETRPGGGTEGEGGEGGEGGGGSFFSHSGDANYLGCDCFYHQAGEYHGYQKYIYSERQVTCPPCTTYTEATPPVYGEPYYEEVPILHAPGPTMSAPGRDPVMVLSVPNSPGGCDCGQKVRGGRL